MKTLQAPDLEMFTDEETRGLFFGALGLCLRGLESTQILTDFARVILLTWYFLPVISQAI